MVLQIAQSRLSVYLCMYTNACQMPPYHRGSAFFNGAALRQFYEENAGCVVKARMYVDCKEVDSLCGEEVATVES
jgi:hypothetical protein